MYKYFEEDEQADKEFLKTEDEIIEVNCVWCGGRGYLINGNICKDCSGLGKYKRVFTKFKSAFRRE